MAGSKQKIDKGVTLIASHTEVVGDVKFGDQLYVSGQVRGNILADHEKATVVVGEEGSVIGEIRVPHIVINGRVEGDVYALTKLELAARARVSGNLHYKTIEMELGAIVDGQLLHEDPADKANVHPLNVEERTTE